MGTGVDPRVGSVSPTEAWDLLKQDQTALLIDVRSRAEWTFVGVPDLSPLGRETIFVPWQEWPGMSRNPTFVEALAEELSGRSPTALLFICRSGARSLAAANETLAYMSEQGVDVGCINVEAGFEGDLDAEGHRGGVSGWKREGLPWRQT
ncbi:rhodanese-like domain-containing protein [Rhodobacterales bacterium HKCCE3408]|nr:rhodanese-like domain-containing protein [Rhodobacterales bacterium HKCCE3408]